MEIKGNPSTYRITSILTQYFLLIIWEFHTMNPSPTHNQIGPYKNHHTLHGVLVH